MKTGIGSKITSLSKKWDTTGGHSPVSIIFNTIYPLSKGAMRCMDQNTFPVTVQKGKFLIKPGQKADHLYLVIKGAVRAFAKEGKKEITTWINLENEIVGSIRSLGLDIPTEEYVQAIETTQLIGIPYSLVEYVYEHFPETNIIGRKILEESYRYAEERAYICRIPSAVKKYNRFIVTHPGIINRIPLKYIASYLGMTIETLSRVRSKQLSFKDPQSGVY